MAETSKRHWLPQVGPSPVILGHGALCQSGPFMVPLPPSGKVEKLQALAMRFFKIFETPMAFGKLGLIT